MSKYSIYTVSTLIGKFIMRFGIEPNSIIVSKKIYKEMHEYHGFEYDKSKPIVCTLMGLDVIVSKQTSEIKICLIL